MKQRISGIRPRFKLWFSTSRAEGVFGDGKWRLLKAIDRHGSLKAAAEAQGMSYRKAWGDIRKAEQCLGRVLIDKVRGGRSGGSAQLTEDGKKWMDAYSRFRSVIEEAVSKAFYEYIKNL